MSTDELTEIPYGFMWGPMAVERVAHVEVRADRSHHVLQVATDHGAINIYVSRTGRSIRVFMDGKELTAEPAARWMDSCIWIDPARRSGEPCFGGTRVPVELAAGLPDDVIQESWPHVTKRHIKTMRWWLDRPGVKTLLRGRR